jgi:aspartate dehydrogenase
VLRVGFIGFGALARIVFEGIRNGKAGDAEVTAVLVRSESAADSVPVPATIRCEEFLASPTDLVVEMAGAAAVALYGAAVLESGKDLMILSVGALANDTLLERLMTAAARKRKKIIIPSGAVAGLDGVAAASILGITDISLTTSKPPRALVTDDPSIRDGLATMESVLVYEGPARKAVELFPANINVAATLSLAGVGFDTTWVRIFVDPKLDANVHSIAVRGDFGELEATVRNKTSENPKTSVLAGLSVLRSIRNCQATLVVG